MTSIIVTAFWFCFCVLLLRSPSFRWSFSSYFFSLFRVHYMALIETRLSHLHSIRKQFSSFAFYMLQCFDYDTLVLHAKTSHISLLRPYTWFWVLFWGLSTLTAIVLKIPDQRMHKFKFSNIDSNKGAIRLSLVSYEKDKTDSKNV